jgi:arabinoxylan arabinofuranohydrolase
MTSKRTILRALKSLLAAFAALSGAASVSAFNPILPLWEYIPDGEPRVFGDRVYLYGAHDRAGSKEYCDYLYRVWSAPLSDLNTWTDHGVSFSTRDMEGHRDDVPWSDNHLYAPDVIEKGGKYWLYAYIVGAPQAVAVSDTPTGPFKLVDKVRAPAGSNHEFGGWGQYIDPGVLVDDDGRVYLYWGYKRSAMAELDPKTMIDILPNTLIPDIIPVEEPFKFFEGVSPRKINGRYHLVYASGDSLVNATSDKPTGPFEFRGAIIRNRGDNPGGNIHGGLAQINGQWYIFYHRQSHNSEFSRRACVERVTIEPDGMIREVEQTSLGFKESLDPEVRTPADVASVLRGRPYVMEFDKDTRAVTNLRKGAVVGYKYFDFGSVPSKTTWLEIDLRDHGVKSEMEVWLDALGTGTLIGRVSITPSGNSDWRRVAVPVSSVEGRRAVLFRISTEKADTPTLDFRSFRFARS